MNLMEHYNKSAFDGRQCPTCKVDLRDLSDNYRTCPKCDRIFSVVRYNKQVAYALPELPDEQLPDEPVPAPGPEDFLDAEFTEMPETRLITA